MFSCNSNKLNYCSVRIIIAGLSRNFHLEMSSHEVYHFMEVVELGWGVGVYGSVGVVPQAESSILLSLII